MHILDLLPAFCSATGKRKPAQRVYLISLVSQCVSLILQLLSQHSDIWNISGLKTRNSRWRDWKKISPRLPLCLSACLSDWHSRVESESESNFICLLSGPHVSWPMTYHLIAVILRQWCCDLALPQSHSPLLTSSCMGLCLGWKGKKRRHKENLTSFLLFSPP